MMTTVGYARVSSLGQDLAVQLEKLKDCDKVFKEKRSGVDAGRPALKACLEYLREGDTLLVTKLDRLARSTPDLYRIVSQLIERGVSFKVVDDPSIDTSLAPASCFPLQKEEHETCLARRFSIPALCSRVAPRWWRAMPTTPSWWSRCRSKVCIRDGCPGMTQRRWTRISSSCGPRGTTSTGSTNSWTGRGVSRIC